MPDLASLSARAFIESMHSLALYEGGEYYRDEIVDGFIVERTYEGRKGAGDTHYEFIARRDRDADTEVVNDTTYEFHEGAQQYLAVLPPEVFNATDIEAEDVEDACLTLSHCTTMLLSTAYCTVEYTHAATFSAGEEDVLQVPTIGEKIFYGDPDDLTPKYTETDSGLRIVEYELPQIDGVQEPVDQDPFAQMAEQLEATNDKAEIAVRRMANILEMLRLGSKP